MSPADKALVAMVMLPCAFILAISYCLSFPMLKIEPLRGLLGGVLFGTFFFSLYPRVLPAFCLLGFCGLMIIDKLRHSNAESNSSANDVIEVNHIIDPITLKDTEYVHSETLSSPDFARNIRTASGQHVIERRRLWNAVFLVVLMVYQCEIQGLYLAGGLESVPSFMIERILDTCAIAIVLVHGLVTNYSPFLYAGLSLFWCVAITTSATPSLADSSPGQILDALNQPALQIVNSLTSGLVLYAAIHYIALNKSKSSYGSITARLILFSGALWAYFLTSLIG